MCLTLTFVLYKFTLYIFYRICIIDSVVYLPDESAFASSRSVPGRRRSSLLKPLLEELSGRKLGKQSDWFTDWLELAGFFWGGIHNQKLYPKLSSWKHAVWFISVRTVRKFQKSHGSSDQIGTRKSCQPLPTYRTSAWPGGLCLGGPPGKRKAYEDTSTGAPIWGCLWTRWVFVPWIPQVWYVAAMADQFSSFEVMPVWSCYIHPSIDLSFFVI